MEQRCVWLFYYFNFESNYDVLSQRVYAFCWTNKKKKKRNRICKIPHTVLEKRTLWWVGACERKKWAFFVPFILPNRTSLNICVLSQCIVYWIHFQKIYTFAYQNIILQALSLLVFRIVEGLQRILKGKDTLWNFSFKAFHEIQFQGHFMKYFYFISNIQKQSFRCVL